MNKVLDLLMESYDFKTISINSDHRLYKSVSGMSSYFVVGLDSIDNFDRDFVESLYDKLTKYEAWKEEDLKNTVLVVTHKLCEENIDDYSVMYQEIEEDKFMFKKHVFSFTEYEMEDLANKIDEFDDVKEFVLNAISDTGSFSNYKSGINEIGWYSLLLKVLIKLPFISLTNQELSFESIEENINKGISDKNLTVYKNILDELKLGDDVEKLMDLIEISDEKN